MTEPAEIPLEERVPKGTTPTWEIEMLLSGAVVFALLQAPAALDAMFEEITSHLAGGIALVAFLLYCYAKGIVYALVLTFVAHLSARAYWIALVGLDSVHPGGPRWEQGRLGRVMREVARETTEPMPRLIAKADDRCSLIFAGGILLVMYALFSLLMTALFGGLSYAIAKVAAPTGGDAAFVVFLIVSGVLVLPTMIAGLLDRPGAKRPPSGFAERYVRWMHRHSLRLPIMKHAYPLLFMYGTHRPKQRTYIVLVILCIGVLYFVMAEALVRRDRLRFDTHRYLPDVPSTLSIDAAYYADTRDDASGRLVPYVQSQVVEGPYLRVFVPYIAERYGAALALECPEVEPLSPRFARLVDDAVPDEAKARAVLDCFARVLSLTLDGRALAQPDLSFATEPNGQRGIVAMIPAAELAPGRHVVSIARPPRRSEIAPDDDEATAAKTYDIPFWR